MKTINRISLLTLAFSFSILFPGCKKDFEKVKIQNHDENEMMTIMHDMMMEMHMMTQTKDPDHDFAMMMKSHHQGAVKMAQYELDNGEDAEMKAMAQKMKDMQQAEINELTTFLNSHNADTTVQEFTDKMMASMEKMDKNSDLQVIIGEADYDFASLMIPHHQSATEMAQAELDHGTNQQMKDMAKKMINDQQKEIGELQDWLIKKKEY